MTKRKTTGIQVGEYVPWPPLPPKPKARAKTRRRRILPTPAQRSAMLTKGAAYTVAGVAVAGSSLGLYRIGVRAELAIPVSLPIAVDMLGLVAAKAMQTHRDSALVKATLFTAVAVSMLAQGADAAMHSMSRDGGRINWGMVAIHMLIAPAAGLAYEMVLKINKPPARRRSSSTQGGTRAKGQSGRRLAAA